MDMTNTNNDFNVNTNKPSLIIMPKSMIIANAPTLRAAIIKLMDKGVNRLVVDLHQVQFIDSSGLSVLVTALKRAQNNDGEVILLMPSDGVRALIELTRLHQVFTIYEDKQAALNYINEQARMALMVDASNSQQH